MRLPVRQQLTDASKVIVSGGVCAYPTESCYGLGCNPKNSKAVKRILQLKHRPAEKGLIVIGSTFSQLEPYVHKLSQELKEKMLSSWPAAITWLVPAAQWVPRWLTGDSDKIAIRIPAHKLARQLCQFCDHALVSTSANLSGQSACRTAGQVKRIFADNIDYIIDMPCGKSQNPSAVINLITNQRIR